MGEIIAGIIRGVIEALFGTLITWTGRTALSVCGLKSNEFVEGLIGFVVWIIITIVLIMLIVWVGSSFAKA